jgi:hypothetical protein
MATSTKPTSSLPPPPPTTTPTSGAKPPTTEVTLDEGHRLPDIKTLQNAVKLSIVEDKPIMMDYWTGSLDKSVMIGIREDGQKMLIKNTEEYTSYINKVYRINGTDYIIMTENSIYLVDISIPTKKVSFDA